MYSGNKPCPSCGKPGHQAQRKDVGSICLECVGLIKIAKDKLEADKKVGGDSLELIYLEFRNVNNYIPNIQKWDDLTEKANGLAHLFLKSVEIKGAKWQGLERVRGKGIDATSCAFFRGVVKRVHWEWLTAFFETFDSLFKARVIDLKESISTLEQAAFDRGKNFLFQQLEADVLGEASSKTNQ